MLATIWRSIVTLRTSGCTPQHLRLFSFSCHRDQGSSSYAKAAPMTFARKLKEYPEIYQVYRASGYTVTREVWARMRMEPELFRVRQQELSHQRRRLWRADEYRALKIQRTKAYYQAHKDDDRYNRTILIRRWIFWEHGETYNAWTRECLPWKTHRPVKHLAKTDCYCSCCGIPRQLKAVWQSTTDPSDFMCHKHFAERGWSEAMPKGYEDVRTFKALRARYDELNGPMASSIALDRVRQRLLDMPPSTKIS